MYLGSKKLQHSETIMYPALSMNRSSSAADYKKFVDAVYNKLIYTSMTTPIVFLVRGTSMAMLAGTLCFLLTKSGHKCGVQLFRKDFETSHYTPFRDDRKFELCDGTVYCIVDDIVASGESVCAILSKCDLTSHKVDYLFASDICGSMTEDNHSMITSNITNIYS